VRELIAASGRTRAGGLSKAADADYAFEMAGSNIRFGVGATREVGLDLVDMGAKHVCVFTDQTLKDLSPVLTVLQSLQDAKVQRVSERHSLSSSRSRLQRSRG
jgi:hydroxyacid-oxoacid transhydrogenase